MSSACLNGVVKAFFRGLALILASAAFPAGAQTDGGWEQVVDGPPITVKQRPVEGLSVNELQAEGHLAAPVQDLQATLTATQDFAKFMPYVKESRFLDEGEDEHGFRLTYALVDMPVAGKRDYVLRTRVVEGVKADGSGNFRNTFVSAPEGLPEKPGVIRIRTDQGGWDIVPDKDGTGAHAVYRLLVDPGGWIPAFATNLATRGGLPDTFRAVEKEAQRRRDERLKAAAAVPADPTPASPARVMAP